MSLVAKLNGQLQQTKVDLHKKQEQVFQLEQEMNEYKQKVQHHGGEIKQLRLHIREREKDTELYQTEFLSLKILRKNMKKT